MKVQLGLKNAVKNFDFMNFCTRLGKTNGFTSNLVTNIIMEEEFFVIVASSPMLATIGNFKGNKNEEILEEIHTEQINTKHT